MRSGSETYEPVGYIETVKDYLHSVISTVRTRLEIFTTELQEEKEWVKATVLYSVFAVFCTLMGILFLSFFIVVLFWDENRLLAVGAVTVLYFGIGITLASMIRKRFREKPRMFATTLSEFEKDQKHLSVKRS